MATTIHKYEISPDSHTLMPRGARILSVHAQDRRIQVWAMVDPDAPTIVRRLALVGTGWRTHDHPSPSDVFVGTVFLGLMVFHVFDLGETPDVE